jgi:hypothetical protein
LKKPYGRRCAETSFAAFPFDVSTRSVVTFLTSIALPLVWRLKLTAVNMLKEAKEKLIAAAINGSRPTEYECFGSGTTRCSQICAAFFKRLL